MNVDFKDFQGCIIQATFYKDAADFFESLILENHVYLLSNGIIKASNKKFTNVEHAFSISFDKQGVVKDITDKNELINDNLCISST